MGAAAEPDLPCASDYVCGGKERIPADVEGGSLPDSVTIWSTDAKTTGTDCQKLHAVAAGPVTVAVVWAEAAVPSSLSGEPSSQATATSTTTTVSAVITLPMDRNLPMADDATGREAVLGQPCLAGERDQDDTGGGDHYVFNRNYPIEVPGQVGVQQATD
jgi:hypothetical protein